MDENVVKNKHKSITNIHILIKANNYNAKIANFKQKESELNYNFVSCNS